MTAKITTTIYLERTQAERLKFAARARRRSMAALIRLAVDQYLDAIEADDLERAEPLPDFGAWLRRRRREIQVTQDQVAAFAGVTQAAVSKWELGQALPEPLAVVRIREWLG